MLGSVLKQLLATRRRKLRPSSVSAPASGAVAAVRVPLPAASTVSRSDPADLLSEGVAGNVFTIDWGVHGMLALLSDYQFRSVLDIGSGSGEHARLFRHFGKTVYSVDLNRNADYVGDFLDAEIDQRFDVVWCCHVLEHQRNVGYFLEKLFDCLTDDGILAISVPSHPRERLVPGHVTSWNAGLLCYNLILAGFDCRQARFLQTQTGDLSLLVRKHRAVGSDIGGTAASGLDVSGAVRLPCWRNSFRSRWARSAKPRYRNAIGWRVRMPWI